MCILFNNRRVVFKTLFAQLLNIPFHTRVSLSVVQFICVTLFSRLIAFTVVLYGHVCPCTDITPFCYNFDTFTGYFSRLSNRSADCYIQIFQSRSATLLSFQFNLILHLLLERTHRTCNDV